MGQKLQRVGIILVSPDDTTGLNSDRPERATVGPCHVSMYHRCLLSSEWMTSVPTMSQHMFPLANDDFTRGKSPLVGDVNGLPDPKPDPIA